VVPGASLPGCLAPGRPAWRPTGLEGRRVPENAGGGKANVEVVPRPLPEWWFGPIGGANRAAVCMPADLMEGDASPDRGAYDIIVVHSKKGTMA
jgi:hypothetical protein